jgi:DNA-binding MarR family transcriptional regulator
MSNKLKKDIKNVISDFAEYNGEEPLQTTVNIITTKKRLPLEPNIMVFQSFAYLAATKLKPSTNKVLMYLFSLSAYENYIGIDIKTLSEELSLTERSIITGLKELEVNNVILKFKHPIDKRRHDYFINPIAAWKGNSFTRKTTIRKVETETPGQLNLFNITKAEKAIKPQLDF